MPTINNNNMIHHLTYQDKEIILLGTAHVSRESVDLVAETIANEKPDTVSVELCESRFQSIQQKDQWRNMDIIKVIREKKAFLLLANLMLASFQKRIADKFNVTPGQEMLQAIESADVEGAEVHLADRNIRITLGRTWRKMGFWGKIKLMFQLLLSMGDVDEIKEEDVERMKQEDVLESLLADVGRSLPVLKNILIDERDQYLAHKIRTAPGRRIVAVVGAGHVPGIKQYIDQEIDVDKLEALPPRGKVAGSIKWIIPGLIIALIGAGFFYGGKETGLNMLMVWIMTNGVLAGIGAVIAMAHPFTIVSAVLAAPLTSLNPMIAAGWVSGLVEAFSRKPKVIDFEKLREDIRTVKGFWTNKVTRILLVVMFTNIGSFLGTFIAGTLMAKKIL